MNWHFDITGKHILSFQILLSNTSGKQLLSEMYDSRTSFYFSYLRVYLFELAIDRFLRIWIVSKWFDLSQTVKIVTPSHHSLNDFFGEGPPSWTKCNEFRKALLGIVSFIRYYKTEKWHRNTYHTQILK